MSATDSFRPMCDPVGSEVRHVRALVVCRHLEPDPGPGAVLLEDQGDRAPDEAPDLAVLALLQLEPGREAEQVLDLPVVEVAQGEERPAEQVDAEVEGHVRSLRGWWRSDGYGPGRAVPASGS